MSVEMAGQYPHYTGYSPYYNVDSGQPMVPHEGYISSYQPYQSLSSEQLHAAYIDYEDSSRPPMGAPPSARGRRRSATGADHVKHRRTRSGCFTCRNRRVKCDETHPICERCRKGNRECIYPEPTSSSKSRAGAKGKSSPTESGDSQDDLDLDGKSEGKEQLPPIPDDEDAEAEELASLSQPHNQSASASLREPSSTPSLTMDKSPSPSTEGSISVPPQPAPARPIPSRRPSRQTLSKASPTKSWNDLPPQLRFYLDYHRTNIGYHHYALKHDGSDWMRTTFLEIAVRNHALLYAVVGFAAYHHTLSKPNGRMQDFLEYYNQSVKLLRLGIERKQRPNVATLLTILQLASIEEVLGDWVNLRGHQRAAYEILTSLYTPQTANQNETIRKALQWYARFDLFVGFQSGYEASIGREWLEENHKYWASQVRDKPNDLGVKYEERFAFSRWLATDVAQVFARRTSGQITDEVFGEEIAIISQKFASWESNVDPVLVNPDSFIKDFTGAPPRDPDSPFDPYDPNRVYGGDLWTTNFMFIDFWAIYLMFKTLMSMAEGKLPGQDVVELAYKSVQLFEALRLCPNTPPGTLVEAQASFAVAALFLQRDEKTIMWCRKQFSAIECNGYIYPNTLRQRIQEAWNIDVSEWWLPDLTTCPPMVRKLRDFADQCTATPRDQTSEDLRVMKGIFRSLNLDDDSDPSRKGKGIMTPNSDDVKGFEWGSSSGSPGQPTAWEQTPPEFKWEYGHDT